MVDCAYCPGAVCVECGRAPADEPFARCDSCAQAIERLQREQRLRERCAGLRCISREPADRERGYFDSSDGASWYCASCDESICPCGTPTDDGGLCERCGLDGEPDDWEMQERDRLLQYLHYDAGLIVRLRGGTYPQVYARLAAAVGSRMAEASYEQLCDGLDAARQWVSELRAHQQRRPVV